MNELNLAVGLSCVLFAWSVFLFVKLIRAKQKIVELEIDISEEKYHKTFYQTRLVQSTAKIDAAQKALRGEGK